MKSKSLFVYEKLMSHKIVTFPIYISPNFRNRQTQMKQEAEQHQGSNSAPIAAHKTKEKKASEFVCVYADTFEPVHLEVMLKVCAQFNISSWQQSWSLAGVKSQEQAWEEATGLKQRRALMCCQRVWAVRLQLHSQPLQRLNLHNPSREKHPDALFSETLVALPLFRVLGR